MSRSQRKTLSGGYDATTTSSVLRRSFELVRRADNQLGGKTDWDLALITQYGNEAPRIEKLRLGERLLTFSLGRHEQNELCLANDSTLSLRHALCVVSRARTGEVVTRVLDLSSTSGIRTADERTHQSIATQGSLALRMADTCLFVIERRDLVDDVLPPFHELAWCRLQPMRAPSTVERELGVQAKTHRRRTAAVTFMGLPEDAWRTSRSCEGDQVASLVFGAGRRSETLALTAARLRSGCLIGRDLRCHINSRDVAMTNAISRIHCLLLEVDDRPMLIDIASMNGIYVEETAHRAVPLSWSQPVRVELARGEQALTYVPKAQPRIHLPPVSRRRRPR